MSNLNRKGCPLLIQSDTNPSWTVAGETHTRTYFLQCIGEKCVAFEAESCKQFHTSTILKEPLKDGGGEDDKTD
jgi:hypothetical protein